MNTNNNVIITEDGQRLQIEDGFISGADNPGPGLAQQTGNVLDEKERPNEEGGACPTPAPKTNDGPGNEKI